MKTVTVQIGNSDDKLTQGMWSWFVKATAAEIDLYSSQVHFSGASDTRAPWQNAAWVFQIEAGNVERLKQRLAIVRAAYRQDSIAWTEGETSFI